MPVADVVQDSGDQEIRRGGSFPLTLINKLKLTIVTCTPYSQIAGPWTVDRAEASVSVAPEAKKTQAKKKIADFSRNKLESGQVPSNYQ